MEELEEVVVVVDVVDVEAKFSFRFIDLSF